jgi:hypothetical protein
MMGAMAAGISAGVAVCFSESPFASAFKWSGDEFIDKLTLSTACGALAGGVTAAMFSSNFGQRFAYGAGSLVLSEIISSIMPSPVSNLAGEWLALPMAVCIIVRL